MLSATRLRTAVRGRRAVPGVTIKAPRVARVDEVLTPSALAFLAELHRKFDPQRKALLAARAERQKRFDAGELPDFLAETKEIRDREGQVAPIPADLQDRRVEITGPVDRKMIVNALNSGATHYMADFEDANAPTWANNIAGQVNLKDLWAGKIAFTDPDSGKDYAVGPHPAVLIVRPRLAPARIAFRRLARRSRRVVRFRPGVFPQRQGADRAGHRALFLPKPRATARLAVERRLPLRPGLGSVGHDQGHGADVSLPAAFEMDEILWER